MAEFVFRQLAQQQGVADRFVVDSAATSDEEHGNPLYPPARQKLQQEGIACEGHRARQITRADYDRYDLLVCMDQSNLRLLARIIGDDPDGKVRLMMSFAGRPHASVADPWYTGDFEQAFQDILTGCEALLKSDLD